MRISVVINTYNRAASLRQTLASLRHQTCRNFEVIVVNGPSADDTDAVLAEFATSIRVASCPEVHLSRSRNVGIAEASGEIVAFIDDDAIPEPSWLDDLLTAYEDPRVGGAGGIVYDHTGFRLQYEATVYNRLGIGCGRPVGFVEQYTRPGADPFLGLLGTNASFRRDCLVQIGGFDEEIEYYLDETEVCMRVIDLGFAIRALANAAVHHKCLPSNRRNEKRLVLDPFAVVKNLFYFALQNGRQTRSVGAVLDGIRPVVEHMKADASFRAHHGELSAAQHEFFLHRLRLAIETGLSRGFLQPRRCRDIPPPERAKFRPFPVLSPAGPRRTFCFLAGAPAPEIPGALTAVAARGHEVHVVTRSPDINRVDFEAGVWVHRLAENDRCVPGLRSLAITAPVRQALAFYHEVCRIHQGRPVDLVVTAPGDGSGLVCGLDQRFATAACSEHPVEQSVTETLEEYEHRIVRHEPLSGGPQAGMITELAILLSNEAGLGPAQARDAAAKLLDPTCSAIDYAAAASKLWHLSPKAFVAELHRLLFNREPMRGEVAHYTARLAGGASRCEVVRLITETEEAQSLQIPTDWLAEVPALTRKSACSSMRGSVSKIVLLPLKRCLALCRRVARSLSSCGRRCLRAALQILRLPATVRKLHADIHKELEKAVRAQEWAFWHNQAALLQIQQLLQDRDRSEDGARARYPLLPGRANPAGEVGRSTPTGNKLAG